MYYDSMIAKLICHGATRDQAVGRMRDALNAFVIRGIDSNIPFQAALMQNTRFLSGVFTTSFIADEFPNGFDESCVVHEDPGLLAALAAFGRRRYIDRAVKISDQMPGHERKVGSDWVVQMEGKDYPITLVPIPGGYSARHGGDHYDLISDWKFGELVFRGTCNGSPICLQLERIGLLYRVVHFGKQVKVTVMTANAARMLALMPKKQPPDLSKFLLSPMPGLLREVSVSVGQQVSAGEKLAVIEAMKMENVLKAELDCKVKKIVAAPGESLSVDQVIIEFE